MEADIFNSVEPEDSNHIMPTVQQHQDINIEEDTPIERKHPLEESHITSPISEKKEVLSPQAINEQLIALHEKEDAQEQPSEQIISGELNNVEIVDEKVEQVENVLKNYSQIESLENETIEPAVKKHKERIGKKISQSSQTFQTNKLLKLIFAHFCKQNYISSIKSTLFQEKQKTMEQMSLNKWMVFCKEFDIFSKLCSIRIQQRKKVAELQPTLQSSQVKQQLKVKEVKEVEKCLTQIFKKSAQNHTKMQLHHFLEALKIVKEEFNTEKEEISQAEFAKSYLFCESEKECLKKLSNLRFTFGIPQIDYAKSFVISNSQNDKQKAKPSSNETKQNLIQIDHKKMKNTNEMRPMVLNPIIKEAKNTLSISQNKSSLTSIRKQASKLKLNLNQPKLGKKKQAKDKEEIQLYKYFDESKDEILQTYFKTEKMQNHFQK